MARLASERTHYHPLRETREAQGLSQRQLGELAGVSDSTICEIERRQRVPREDTCYRLLQALGLPGDALYSTFGDPWARFEPEHPNRQPTLLNNVTIYRDGRLERTWL